MIGVAVAVAVEGSWMNWARSNYGFEPKIIFKHLIFEKYFRKVFHIYFVNSSRWSRLFIVIINLLNDIICPSAIWLPYFIWWSPWLYRLNWQFRSCDRLWRWFFRNFPTTWKWIKNIPLNQQCMCCRLFKCEWLYERSCELTMLNQIYANFSTSIFFYFIPARYCLLAIQEISFCAKAPFEKIDHILWHFVASAHDTRHNLKRFQLQWEALDKLLNSIIILPSFFFTSFLWLIYPHSTLHYEYRVSTVIYSWNGSLSKRYILF